MGNSSSKDIADSGKTAFLHYRLLDEIPGRDHIPTLLAASHWCIQVGEKYYQLKNPKKRPKECKSSHSAPLYNGSGETIDGSVKQADFNDCIRVLGEKTDLLISEEQSAFPPCIAQKSRSLAKIDLPYGLIENQAKVIFAQRFSDKYDFAIENCQTFALFLYMALYLRTPAVSWEQPFKLNGTLSTLGATLLAYMLWSLYLNRMQSVTQKALRPWLIRMRAYIDPDKIDWAKVVAPMQIQLNQNQMLLVLQGNVDREMRSMHTQLDTNQTNVINMQLSVDTAASNSASLFQMSQPNGAFGGLPP